MSTRSFRHWTPRYAVDRVRWEIYERRHQDEPWLGPEANTYLSTLLMPTDIGLEWGSGRSTAWLARRISHLTSMEDVPHWHRQVSLQLQSDDVKNVAYHLAERPPEDDGAWSSEYVGIAAKFADRSLGFALVDGSAREYCAASVIPKIAPGGILVLDDTNGYFDYASRAVASRAGLGPKNSIWAEVANTLADWRMLRTSSALKDTAIYVRPDLRPTT